MSEQSTPKDTTPTNDAPPVLVEFEDGIAWVTLNRPNKRNAINPGIVYSMLETMESLETDDRCKVMVLTGAGDAFSAGMDLREYFRGTDNDPKERIKLFRANGQWQWRMLRHYSKPTIAMVNGWCFGGAFTPLVSCDLAIAAEGARSVCRKSTGASFPPASSAAPWPNWCANAKRCTT